MPDYELSLDKVVYALVIIVVLGLVVFLIRGMTTPSIDPDYPDHARLIDDIFTSNITIRIGQIIIHVDDTMTIGQVKGYYNMARQYGYSTSIINSAMTDICNLRMPPLITLNNNNKEENLT